MTVESINMKNQTYYFLNDMIDLKYFDSNLLKLDKNSNKSINVYHIICDD